MRTLRVLTAVIVIQLAATAGCLDARNPPAPDADEHRTTRSAHGTLAPTDREFHWRGENLGTVGIRWNGTFAEAAECDVAGTFVGTRDEQWPGLFFVIYADGAWVDSPASPLTETSARAHYEDVDTRSSARVPYERTERPLNPVTLVGHAEVFFGAPDVHAAEISVTCTRPFGGQSLALAPNLTAVGKRTGHGGMGAQVGSVASVTRGTTVFEFESDESVVELLMWTYALEQRLTLHHPEGEVTWTNNSAPDRFTGGPGRYRMTADRVAVGIDILIGTIGAYWDIQTQ